MSTKNLYFVAPDKNIQYIVKLSYIFLNSLFFLFLIVVKPIRFWRNTSISRQTNLQVRSSHSQDIQINDVISRCRFFQTSEGSQNRTKSLASEDTVKILKINLSLELLLPLTERTPALLSRCPETRTLASRRLPGRGRIGQPWPGLLDASCQPVAYRHNPATFR